MMTCICHLNHRRKLKIEDFRQAGLSKKQDLVKNNQSKEEWTIKQDSTFLSRAKP
jgi:hypothetical protein